MQESVRYEVIQVNSKRGGVSTLKKEYKQEKIYEAEKIACERERELKREMKQEAKELEIEEMKLKFDVAVENAKDYATRLILFVVAWSIIIGVIYILIKLI